MEASLEAERQAVIAEIQRFVEREVIPAARKLEHDDTYPVDLIDKLKILGIFSATIPEAYGGLGFDLLTYVQIIEQLSRGWMSLAGIVNTPILVAYMMQTYGTEEQRQRFLPSMATGDKRGGSCISEDSARSDVQAITMDAVRDGDDFVPIGSKRGGTNGVHGGIFAGLAGNSTNVEPPHGGVSVFVVEKG